MEMNGASPFGDGTKPWRPEGAREFKIGHCPSTHVLGYDCVALRARAVQVRTWIVRFVSGHGFQPCRLRPLYDCHPDRVLQPEWRDLPFVRSHLPCFNSVATAALLTRT